MKNTTTTYYRVELGGSMYQDYETKEEALKKAIERSIGKDWNDFTPIYRIKISKTFDTKIVDDVLIKEQTTKTLAMLVSPRPSANATGGWVDYEA